MAGDGEEVRMLELLRCAIDSSSHLCVFGAPPTVRHLPTFGYYRKAIRLVSITGDFETNQLTLIGPAGGLVYGLLFLSLLVLLCS